MKTILLSIVLMMIYLTIQIIAQPIIPDKLLNKFDVKVDKMDNSITYRHRYFKYRPETQCSIESVILYDTKTNRQKLALYSSYTSSDWIFHNHVKFMIIDTVKETSTDKSPFTNVEEGYVSEICSYHSIEDFNIVIWIARNKDKEVSVRFVGRNGDRDFTLTDDCKSAIKETIDLYNVINIKK
jgi:hypothetical protein